MGRNGKRLICLLMLGAMLLMLTGCDRTDAMNNFETALLRFRDALNAADQSNAVPALTADPVPTAEPYEEPEYTLEEDELPRVPA